MAAIGLRSHSGLPADLSGVKQPQNQRRTRSKCGSGLAREGR